MLTELDKKKMVIYDTTFNKMTTFANQQVILFLIEQYLVINIKRKYYSSVDLDYGIFEQI